MSLEEASASIYSCRMHYNKHAIRSLYWALAHMWSSKITNVQFYCSVFFANKFILIPILSLSVSARSRPLFFYLHFSFLFSDSLNEGFTIEMNIIQKYWAQICPATIRSLECYRDSETMRKKINSLFFVEFFSTEILP